MLVGEGHAGVDELAGGEVGAGLLRGGLEGQVREGGGRGVRGEGTQVEVGCGAEDLGEDDVADGGDVLCLCGECLVRLGWFGLDEGWREGKGRASYALRVVFYPHGVLDGVGDELAGDGGHDVGGRDVAEAGAEAERVFWVGGDERGVDCLAWEDERAVGCHGGRFG